jgi:hypothetical protein
MFFVFPRLKLEILENHIFNIPATEKLRPNEVFNGKYPKILFPILWQQIPQEDIDNLIRRIREVRGRNADYLKLKQKLFHLIYFYLISKVLIFF